MSIKNYIKKYMNPKSGAVVPVDERQAVESYYLHHIAKQQANIACGINTSTKIQKASQVGKTTSNTLTSAGNSLNMHGSTTTGNLDGSFGSWSNWDDKAKEFIAKIGFKYNKKKDVWELELIATVEIKEPQGLMATLSDSSDGSIRDEAIAAIKRVKNNLIKKLTAKLILIELTKPREIKE